MSQYFLEMAFSCMQSRLEPRVEVIRGYFRLFYALLMLEDSLQASRIRAGLNRVRHLIRSLFSLSFLHYCWSFATQSTLIT